MALDEADPIWGEMPATVESWGDGRAVECARSGRYTIAGTALGMIGALSPLEKAKLTTLIVDSNRIGEVLPITSYTIEQVRTMRQKTFADRMDRFLAYFAHLDMRPGIPIAWLGAHTHTDANIRSKQEALAWIEGVGENELYAFRDLLVDADLARYRGDAFSISPAGFQRIDELRQGGAPTNRAFVAMWFNAETEDAYSNGIHPALIETGFDPIRIDKKEHINKIDDEIVAEIKRAKFVVADFTSQSVKVDDSYIYIPRGGVYYEAGLAQGRDIPVIWMVRADQIENVHFDTRQFNHITWENPEDLRAKLCNRIRAIFAEAK